MKLYEIRDILEANVLVGADQLDKVIYGGGGADMMEDVLAAVAKEAVLLSGLTKENVIRTARISEIGAVVFVRGKNPDKGVVELAASYDLPVLLTKFSLFDACGRLYMHGLRGIEGSW